MLYFTLYLMVGVWLNKLALDAQPELFCALPPSVKVIGSTVATLIWPALLVLALGLKIVENRRLP